MTKFDDLHEESKEGAYRSMQMLTFALLIGFVMIVFIGIFVYKGFSW